MCLNYLPYIKTKVIEKSQIGKGMIRSVKPVLSNHSKIDKTKGQKSCNYLQRLLVLKTYFLLSSLSGRLRQVLLYLNIEDFLEKSMRINYALKILESH